METNDHFPDELESCDREKEEESTMEMETDTAAPENCVTVKIEVETDTDENWSVGGCESSEVYTDTAENWPVDGCERSEADDPIVKTEVKIEFDVAEDLSQSRDVTAEQYVNGDKNQTRVRRSGRKRAAVQVSGSVEDEEPGATSSSQLFSSGKFKKPKRPCVYCGEFFTCLRRHLPRKHAGEKAVKAASKLPRGHKRDTAFAAIRKNGMLEKNRKLLNEGTFLRERAQGAASRVMCGGCLGFFSKNSIKKHKKKSCGRTASLQMDTIDFRKIPSSTTVTSEFQEQILNHFRDDTVGLLCCNDPTIILLGQKLLAGSAAKGRHNVISSMRLVAKLLVGVRENSERETLTGEDLVKEEHFDSLEKAIHRVSTDTKTGKHKVSVYITIGAVLKKLVVFMKAHYTQTKQKTKQRELDVFKRLLDHAWAFIFKPAEMECESRKNQLRKPQEMPLEQDVKTFRDYVVQRTKTITEDPDKQLDTRSFIELRNLIVARLTLFNARRGAEPSRLLLSEWEDALKGVWIDPDSIEKVDDQIEKALGDQYKLAYQVASGGRKLVPVLIPLDTIDALKMLVSERASAQINANNPYLFPGTGGSIEHASGYRSIKTISASETLAGQLRQPNLLIAEKFHHRASTIFALQDIPAGQREPFYRHIGKTRSRKIDKARIRTRPEKEITQVGGFLHSLDVHGKTIPTSKTTPSSTVTSAVSSAQPTTGTTHKSGAQDSSQTSAQASFAQDLSAQLSSAQNSSAQPSSAQNSSAQPTSAQDPSAQPSSAQNSSAQPRSAQSSVTKKKSHVVWKFC